MVDEVCSLTVGSLWTEDCTVGSLTVYSLGSARDVVQLSELTVVAFRFDFG